MSTPLPGAPSLAASSSSTPCKSPSPASPASMTMWQPEAWSRRHSVASGNMRHLSRHTECRQPLLPHALEHRDRRPQPEQPSVNLGGLDIELLAGNHGLQEGSNYGLPTNNCKTTTDLGQALIDGKFDHVGKIKGPILRGLAARAPYFHNGSAATLLDAVNFYNTRFNLHLSEQDKDDLVAFLKTL